jgi:hypothetical protein
VAAARLDDGSVVIPSAGPLTHLFMPATAAANSSDVQQCFKTASLSNTSRRAVASLMASLSL